MKHTPPPAQQINRFLGFYYLGNTNTSKARQLARIAQETLLNHLLSPTLKR